MVWTAPESMDTRHTSALASAPSGPPACLAKHPTVHYERISFRAYTRLPPWARGLYSLYSRSCYAHQLLPSHCMLLIKQESMQQSSTTGQGKEAGTAENRRGKKDTSIGLSRHDGRTVSEHTGSKAAPKNRGMNSTPRGGCRDDISQPSLLLSRRQLLVLPQLPQRVGLHRRATGGQRAMHVGGGQPCSRVHGPPPLVPRHMTQLHAQCTDGRCKSSLPHCRALQPTSQAAHQGP